MLRLDLQRLDREGTVRVDGRIPADDELWQESGVTLDGPLDVALRASRAGSGEVVVRGRLEGRLKQECRRCLRKVPAELDEEVTIVFVPSDQPGEEGADDVRAYDAQVADLDLEDAVREEVILATDPYVVCEEECRGLCPKCGADRNTESCDCTFEEADPRWDALRSLQSE